MDLSLRTLSQAAVMLVAAAIIAEIVRSRFAEVADSLATVDPVLVAASLVVLWAGMLVSRYTWKLVVDGLGYEMSLLRAMTLISLFEAASYIPGGFWHFLGMTYWAEEDGMPKKVTAVGTAVNAGTAVIVALSLFFAVAPFYLPTGSVLRYVPLALAIPTGLVAVHPRVFYPVLNRGLRLIGHDPIEPDLSYRRILEMGAVNVVARTLTGTALFLLINALTPLPLTVLPAIVALYAGAWAVGFLVLFVPGGLGVKEVTAIYLFGLVMSQSVAAVAVVGFRVMLTLSEFVLAAVFWTVSQGGTVDPDRLRTP